MRMKFVAGVAIVMASVMASACSGGGPNSPSATRDTNKVLPPSGSVLVVGDTINVSHRVEATSPVEYGWVFRREVGTAWMVKCKLPDSQSGGGVETQVASFNRLVDSGLYAWANGQPIRLELTYAPTGLCPRGLDIPGSTRIEVASWGLAQSR